MITASAMKELKYPYFFYLYMITASAMKELKYPYFFYLWNNFKQKQFVSEYNFQ